jgi:hypothetical protein
MKTIKQLLHYCATQEEAIIIYSASKMIPATATSSLRAPRELPFPIRLEFLYVGTYIQLGREQQYVEVLFPTWKHNFAKLLRKQPFWVSKYYTGTIERYRMYAGEAGRF